MVGLLTAAFTLACISLIISSLGFHRAIRKYCITNCKYFNGSLNMFVGEGILLVELFSIFFVVALIGLMLDYVLITCLILLSLSGFFFILADGYINYLLTERYRK